MTTSRKNKPKPRYDKQNTEVNGIARSMLSDVEHELAAAELNGGEMTHTRFDCPLNLRETYKQTVRAEGSSMCKELVISMYNRVIEAMLRKHALGNTMGKLVKFPSTVNYVLPTVVQSRKRRWARQSVEEDKQTGRLPAEQLKQREELEKMDKLFVRVLEQWDLAGHGDNSEWTKKQFVLAGKWADRLESARQILEKREGGEKHE